MNRRGGGRGGLGYNYLEGAKFLKKWDFFWKFFLHRSKPFYGNPAGAEGAVLENFSDFSKSVT